MPDSITGAFATGQMAIRLDIIMSVRAMNLRYRFLTRRMYLQKAVKLQSTIGGPISCHIPGPHQRLDRGPSQTRRWEGDDFGQCCGWNSSIQPFVAHDVVPLGQLVYHKARSTDVRTGTDMRRTLRYNIAAGSNSEPKTR